MSARTMPETVVPSHFPLAAVLWPHRADGSSRVLRSVILIALGTALLTLSDLVVGSIGRLATADLRTCKRGSIRCS